VRRESFDRNIVAQVMEQWPAFVNTLKKFSVSLKAACFLLVFQIIFKKNREMNFQFLKTNYAPPA
jgi:hypothetical protein